MFTRTNSVRTGGGGGGLGLPGVFFLAKVFQRQLQRGDLGRWVRGVHLLKKRGTTMEAVTEDDGKKEGFSVSCRFVCV